MDSKPYRLADADTFYFSGDLESGPYQAAKKVLKTARAKHESPTHLTVDVQYIPSDSGEPSYWAASVTAST